MGWPQGLVIISAAVAGVLLVRRCARGCGAIDFEKIVDRMPEEAPPKWMFRNITAIRDNTERILELLDKEPSAAEPERAAA